MSWSCTVYKADVKKCVAEHYDMHRCIYSTMQNRIRHKLLFQYVHQRRALQARTVIILLIHRPVKLYEACCGASPRTVWETHCHIAHCCTQKHSYKIKDIPVLEFELRAYSEGLHRQFNSEGWHRQFSRSQSSVVSYRDYRHIFFFFSIYPTAV